MIKAIIFDWHGVLDKTKLELLIEKLSEITGLNLDQVKDLIKPIEREWAKGEDPKIFWNKVQKIFNLAEGQVSEAKNSILRIIKYQPLWNRLPELKHKYRLAILSDNPRDKVQLIREEADLSFFEAVHFSCERHLLKDSAEFFLGILKELNEKPENCLYVDDKKVHTDTASKLGFKTCTFKTINDLLKLINLSNHDEVIYR